MMSKQMNKQLVVHGGWFLAAMTSFVLGNRLFPSGEARGDPVAKSDPRFETRAGTKSLGSAEGVRTREGRGVLRSGSPSDGGPLREVPQLSGEDIARLGEEFRTSSSPVDRRLAFADLLEGLTAENALQIREQIAHMRHHSAEFREFHYAWGGVAGTEAVMFGADTKEDDMAPALAGWAGANPDAARAWFEALDPANDARFDQIVKERKIPAEDLRNHLMRGLVHGLADADPNAAVNFLQATVATGGNERAAGLMHVVAEAAMRSGSQSDAAQWAETLPEGALRGVAMNRVADRYVDVDPDAAAAWAEKFSNQPEGAGVIGEVGANWAWRDPQAALSWLQDLPEGASQSAGMARALKSWAHRDPAAAGEHLQSMPETPARDAAVSGYSQRVAREDPQAAMNWAETISSPDERLEAMIGVGRTWAKRDANGAAEWVNSSGLPEDVQAAILNPQRDRR